MKQPLQQQVGIQRLSLPGSEPLLPDRAASSERWGFVIYMRNKTPPECSWSSTFEQH